MNIRWLFFVGIIFILGIQQKKESIHKPMFFNMSQEFKEIVGQEKLFKFKVKDTSSVMHQLQLLSNAKGKPRLFYSDIETPVCADGECKFAKIKVYWNLLGDYVGFGIYDKSPLTKNEHDPFTNSDYKKLHDLLGDRHSILERRKIADLIDSIPVIGVALKTYKGVDAISGATKKEIKESVVKGGLYSCYTLWHLVNGSVVLKMQTHLKKIYSDSISNYFLRSSYSDYQDYGLKKLKADRFEENFEDIIRIFESTSPITRSYILKKIPNSLFSKETITKKFYMLFADVDMNTRTQLIQKMKLTNGESSTLLIDHIEIMTKNQLNTYLEFFQQEPSCLDSDMKKSLKKYARSKDFRWNYVVKDFIATL